MTLYEFFIFLWDVGFTAATNTFMNSELSLLIYMCIIAAVICYFINLVKYMRKF